MSDDLDDDEFDDEFDDKDYIDDDFCVECGDPFHYDDVGGYNPPCECGFHCRSCHEAVEGRRDPDDDYERPEDSYPEEFAE